MYCPQCGATNAPGSAACYQCRAPFRFVIRTRQVTYRELWPWFAVILFCWLNLLTIHAIVSGWGI